MQIPEISAETEISFKVQSSDSSVASAGGRSLGMRVVDFAFDVNWVGAGTCVVAITAVCNCSANASSALLYVRSLPLLVATPSFVDVINPQSNVTINISLQQPITSIIVINLQPNVPLAFFLSPATVTITPSAPSASVTLAYGRPGRYTVVASSPFPGLLSGLLLSVATVVVRPLLLAEQYDVVIPQKGTFVIKFQRFSVPVDAPMTINISPSTASAAPPAVSLNATTFAVVPTSVNSVLCFAVTSTSDFWASGSTVFIQFTVTAPESSIYSGAQGVTAIVHLLPRLEVPSSVYVPLLGRSVIAIGVIRTVLQADTMSVRIEGGGSEVLMLQPLNVTRDIDGSTLYVPVRCVPNTAATRNLYLYITGGALDGAVVGPVAVICMRRSISAEPAALSIARDKTATFYLRCNVPPDADITVSLKFSRDGCATLDKSSVLIPARTDASTAFAVTIRHLQPCAVAIYMEIFSFYGNYALDASIDSPQPVLVSLLGSATISPSSVTLTRGQTANLALTLNPPADIPLFISFIVTNTNSTNGSSITCAALDPPSLVVAQGQGGPFALIARHNAAGACTVDIQVAARSSSSAYSRFLGSGAVSLLALAYVEINGDKALRVRGGAASAFAVRLLPLPSASAVPQLFNVTFAAASGNSGITLSPTFIILTAGSNPSPLPNRFRIRCWGWGWRCLC